MDDMIIVGASGGIGSYLASVFEGEFDLYRTYYRTQIRGVGNVAQMNVLNPQRVREFADEIGPQLSEKVVLVNATGLSINGMGHNLPQSSFSAVVQVNLVGAFNLASAFLPIMRRKRWGRIINMSSVVGKVGVAGTAAYASSKTGLLGLTRTLAIENAKKGVTVNVLRLGYMSAGMINTIEANTREAIRRSIPMEFFGSPDNVVEAIRFLVNAPYVTGTAIDIDGGLLCS